jgi:hypothetical protein
MRDPWNLAVGVEDRDRGRVRLSRKNPDEEEDDLEESQQVMTEVSPRRIMDSLRAVVRHWREDRVAKIPSVWDWAWDSHRHVLRSRSPESWCMGDSAVPFGSVSVAGIMNERLHGRHHLVQPGQLQVPRLQELAKL